MKKRKNYSPQFKEDSISQIASEYDLHPSQLSRWKNQFVKDAASMFKDENQPLNKLKADYEKKIENLYTEVGKLTTRVNWLKKKCGQIDKG